MHLVLCCSNDVPAIWAYEGLKARGLTPLELVTSETLGYARLWEHRLGSGGVHLKIGLTDGRTLCSSRIRGVLNRLLSPHQDVINMAKANDRDYAIGEVSAFYLSWLHGLPGVVLNRPTPQGLCGQWRHGSEWAMLAAQAGLSVPVYRLSGRSKPEDAYSSFAPVGAPVRSALVLGEQVFGAAVPDNVRPACCEFANRAGSDLIGIDFFESEQSPWTFASATPYPDLMLGGEALLDSLAAAMRNGDVQ